MVQRGVINLGQGMFRVSAAGFDVRTATPDQLLIDERVLYNQILQSIYVPFNSPVSTVTVPLIDYGFVPQCYAYSRTSAGEDRTYPAPAIWSPAAGTRLQNHFFYEVTRNSLTVHFPTPTTLRGAQVLTMRP
ncbi:hypothetical protein [Ochrobactrum sp. SFR4]|uniref:hypothetical protein n=1 Tax=Ochrobactrum sp. SFR4 TaxID=2717368 RepID=UPI001C8BA5D6|nr:hypothetical protein [Ochrobactrum sp. SFR4]MBX8827262.1 hypothetical protein [Ochrobactrum sp. SFR4]